MRESTFIQQRKEKWKSLEDRLDATHQDPDQVRELMTEITDDLSYARTFFPHRSVRVYLNHVAQRLFLQVYTVKQSRWSQLWLFWKQDLPLHVYQAKSAFRLSFFVFALAVVIGAFSAHHDGEFVRTILGDSYVDMTLENIKNGDPMAVYKDDSPFGMSLGITLNNLMVDLWIFVMGIFYLIGSIGILLANGVMVGAFQYFFIQQGVVWDSLLTIWMHGTLEMAAAVIAGAAGITMGQGLVFPGTLSIRKSFQLSVRKGIKILIGIFPLTIVAGFIEGYITRHTEIPLGIRATFIALCLLFVIGYFIIYPIFVGRKTAFEDRDDWQGLTADTAKGLQLFALKGSGSLFQDTFMVVRMRLSSFLSLSALLSFIYVFFTWAFGASNLQTTYILPNGAFSSLQKLPEFFGTSWLSYGTLLGAVQLLAVFAGIVYLFDKLSLQDHHLYTPAIEGSNFALRMLYASVPIYLLTWCLGADSAYFSFGIILYGPFFALWALRCLYNGEGTFLALKQIFSLLNIHIFQLLALNILLFLALIFTTLILDSSLLSMLFEFFMQSFSFSETTNNEWMTAFTMFSNNFLLCLFMMVWATGQFLTLFSLLEIKEAPQLHYNIQKIGDQKRIRGMLRE